MAALERAVFASPGAGSTVVSLLCESIKKERLDEKNGLALDMKYFDPAEEQAVMLRRDDAGSSRS